MNHSHRGFTLIELIAVMILVGILSVVLMSRVGGVNSANVQSGRDSLVAALFFAQQTAMARDNIQFTSSGNTVNVTESGTSLTGYPVTLKGVTLSPASTFTYDRLGRIAGDGAVITIANNAGVSARVTVEASGYAHY